MSDQYRNWPLKDVQTPHDHDVLCGRGGGSNSHVGNMHWRMLVAANKELYVTLPKKQKLLLSMSIVNAVRSQNPPGRFLQKDASTELFYDVGDQRAQEKTSQALREGAPDIKKKIANPLGHAANATPPKGAAVHAAPKVAPPVIRGCPRVYPPVPVPLPPPVPAQGPVPVRHKKKSAGPVPQTLQDAITEQDRRRPNDYSATNSAPTMSPTGPNEPEQLHPDTAGQQHQSQYAPTMRTELAPPVDGGLEPSALSFGTYMSIGTIDTAAMNGSGQDFSDIRHDRPPGEQPGEITSVSPVDGGLEAFQGVSFGTAVMSVDSLQLERAGLSIGSVMSLGTMPVDGGLDAIGTSFGSMSLSKDVPGAVDGGLNNIGLSFGSLSLSAEDRAILINSLREDNIEIPAVLESVPTFLSAQRSKGNLLECSDTDSDEESRKASGPHPSADWEKLQATLASQTMAVPPTSISTRPAFRDVNSSPHMDSSTNQFIFSGADHEFCVPVTGFDRDLSALSVGDFEPSFLPSSSTEQDRRAMPPPANRIHPAAPELSQLPPPPSAELKSGEAEHWDEYDRSNGNIFHKDNSLAGHYSNGT